MLLLCSDFGHNGPYVGEMTAAARRTAPAATPIVQVMHDLPAFNPAASAYLLAALLDSPALPADAVVVAVVDPGVGSARRALAVQAGERWLVAPDNGLLEIALRRAAAAGAAIRPYAITWQPAQLSASFHGRDLFAPMGGALAAGRRDGLTPLAAEALRCPSWPDDWAAVIYTDGYGNAMTGLRAASVPAEAGLRLGGQTIPRARTFADVAPGDPLVYTNSAGLLEIAVNQGSAAAHFGLVPGSPVGWPGPPG